MEIVPEDGETPIQALLRQQSAAETKREWLEGKLIRISDCPRCYVCDGARIWKGHHGRRNPDGSDSWATLPCMICGGLGRMPFIEPT